MTVKIIEGPHTEENIQKAYQIIIRSIRKELQEALKAGKTEEEYFDELKKKGEKHDAENKR